jgi:DNA anti-recombination protein RmuC
MFNEASTLGSNALLLTLIAVLLLFIVLLLVILILKNRQVHDLTYPVYDYIVKGAHKKAHEITYDAMKRSREMLTDAELEGVKVVAKGKLEAKHIEEEYEQKMDELLAQTESMLAEYSKRTDAELKRLAEALEKRIAAGIQKNETLLQEETDKLSKQLSSTFSTLEANAKEQIRSNVEKEFIGVKKVVEAYRQERFALIDNELLSLLEGTTQLALQRSLTLSDHTELLYKALEEAKANNTFSQ